MNRDNLELVRVSYPKQSLDSALSAPTNQQLVVHSIAAINGSVSPNDVGICHSINVAGLTVTGLAELTLPLAAASTLIGTTDGDSLTVQSKTKFGLLALQVSQAGGGSPVYVYEYWNGAWVSLTTDYTPDFSTTGTKVVLFTPPVDWSLDADDRYSIRIVGSTAPSTAVQATSLKVCQMISYREGLFSGAELLVRFDTRQLLLQQGEEIIGFFAFPSSSNSMEASYQICP